MQKTLLKRKKEIVTVKDSTTVADAIETLAKNKISSVPVIHTASNTIMGSVDLLDLVTFTCAKLGLENIDLYTSKLQAQEFFKPVGDLCDISGRNKWCVASYKTPLRALMRYLSDANTHRIAITNEANDIVGLLTQSKVVEFIFRSKEKSPFKELMTKKVKELWQVNGTVQTINFRKNVIDALVAIYEKEKSGIAVVNDIGELIGNISAGDLKRVQLRPPIQLTYDVYQTIETFLNIVGDSSMRFLAGLPQFKPVFVTVDTTLEEMLTKIVGNNIHRIYVVESLQNKKPTRVISLCDILALFGNQSSSP